jgi:dihydrofolate synthase / folylpolyglutamate synthase
VQLYSSIMDKKNPPKVIHVAGTKGKGSTVEYIAAALRSNNARVGVFTSPHIHSARERVKIGLDLISKESFIRLGNEAIQQMGDKPWVVFFDLLMYVALRHFCEEKVDYIVLETGIGGRYDSTNIFDDPVAIAITSISLDHQAMLGSTVEQIAWQKAGIIKANSQVFTSTSQLPSVLQVFREECALKGSTLHEVPANPSNLAAIPIPCPPYDVQIENACVASALLDHIRIPAVGMKNFFWPCRMETFTIDGVEVVLDGCHNGDSVEQFLKSLRKNYPRDRLLIIFGAGAEKCLDDMLVQVLEHSDQIIIAQSKHFRAMPEKQLTTSSIAMNKHSDKLVSFSNLEGKILTSTVGSKLQWAIDFASMNRYAFCL